MARGGQRQQAGRRTASRGRKRAYDNEGIIPVLARTVREVENAVKRRSAMPSVRTKFQVVALLVREERARVKADESMTEARREAQLKRLDGIATILAQTAAREPSFFHLLAEDAEITAFENPGDLFTALQANQIDAMLEPLITTITIGKP